MAAPQVFDSLAQGYDDTFTNMLIGRYLRERIHKRLVTHFKAGDHVLELGCGTGEDALYLAERGVQVTATDVSEAMLEVARTKTSSNPLVNIKHFDLSSLSDVQLSLNEKFDGVFSNFGPLNCLSDWKPLATWLSEQVKVGGMIGLGVMSPFCVLEPLWHGIHLDFKTATRRWRNTTFQPDSDSKPISVHYPTIRRITSDFEPHFQRIHVEGIGLFLPPSDVFGAVEKHPHLLKWLTSLENRFAKYPKLALFADHYWIEFRRH